MSDSPTVTLSLAALASLGVEHWRLSNCLANTAFASSAPARHALRRIEDVLRECEVEVMAMNGKPFDPGIAAEVIDCVEDESLPAGQVIVDETLSPLVLWRGQVIKPAQVVTRAGVKKTGDEEERGKA